MNRCAAQHFFRQMSSGPEKRIRDKLIQSLIYLDFVDFFGLLSTWTWVSFSEGTATTKTHSGFSNVWLNMLIEKVTAI